MNRLFEMLERLSLRSKLIIGFAALLILILILGVQSLRTQYSLRNEMQQLYIETIQSVCKNDYNPEQIEAWISGVKNKERWIEVIDKQFVLLAVSNNKIAGFGTLKDGNYIDFFYIHKGYFDAIAIKAHKIKRNRDGDH